MAPRQRCLYLTSLVLALARYTSSLPRFDSPIEITQPRSPQLQADLILGGDRRVLRRRQDDQLHNDVNQPGQQTQNITSTAGTGSSGPEQGMITNDNTTLPQVDCRYLYTGRDNKCWNELRLSDWVVNWLATHSCYANEPFSSCFLRQEGYWGLDCTGLKLDTCVPPQPDRDDVTPESFYVAYNIYAINQFFLSWYTAVGDAGQTAGMNIDEILQITRVPDHTNLIMDNILIALSGVFALAPVGMTAIRGAMSLGTKVAASMQIVENALFAYPQIGRYLFPVGGADATLIAIADLKTSLVDVIQEVQNNLNKTLVSVMTNVTEYLAFASQGNFSSSPPSLPDQTNYLLYGFNTYIVSEALAGDDVHAILAVDTNPLQLATNGTKLNYDIGCESYDENAVCGQWWWDQEQNIAYGLNDFRNPGRDMNEVLTKLLSKYTTGELLLRNAYACNLNGGYGKPVNVTVNAAGVNTACLSQLHTLYWDMSCRDAKVTNQCEFVNWEAQGSWMGSGGSQSYWSVMDDPIYCVPKSYIGPMLSQTSEKLSTC